MPNFFTKPKEDNKQRNVKSNLARINGKINNNSLPEPLEEVGPNVVMPSSIRGTYFITIDEGHVKGAIYCSDYRDVITEGLGPQYSDIIQSVVFFDAIAMRGITPLQTLEGSIPPMLREALGFVGPEKDEYTSAKRWVLK
jgi:hypothetical protein